MLKINKTKMLIYYNFFFSHLYVAYYTFYSYV